MMEAWPAPAAGIRSGRACASAPVTTSSRRTWVAERLPTETPGSGLRRLPRGVTSEIGRTSPELKAMSERVERRKLTKPNDHLPVTTLLVGRQVLRLDLQIGLREVEIDLRRLDGHRELDPDRPPAPASPSI